MSMQIEGFSKLLYLTPEILLLQFKKITELLHYAG